MRDWYKNRLDSVAGFERYMVISSYYKNNPERVSENRDYISEIMLEALSSVKNFRVGDSSDIEGLMKNFGIEDIVFYDSEVDFVFKK